MNKRSGITLVGVIVVLFIFGVLFAVFFPAISGHPMNARMTAVSARGRDIYVAIAGANAEREAVGLPPIWPSDAPPYTNHVTGKIECFDFENSSDYFDYINDGKNLGSDNWEPFISGFDFGKLAGAGIASHTGRGPLKAENNMWTIAKNVSDEMDDIIPVLVTRNLDANYLYAKIEGTPTAERIPLAKTWKTPFKRKGAVIIRKGGGAFIVRQKYATPMLIYNGQSFDADANSKYPFKYLTPTEEVLPIAANR